MKAGQIGRWIRIEDFGIEGEIDSELIGVGGDSAAAEGGFDDESVYFIDGGGAFCEEE